MSPALPSDDMPVELSPPDISVYRHGNVGIDHVHRFTSPEPGPHVLLTAVVHGNELCGAIALDWLMRTGLRPRCGTLTLAFVCLARRNIAGHRQAMVKLYWGACVGAGVFTLLPSRYLGQLVWGQWLGLLG